LPHEKSLPFAVDGTETYSEAEANLCQTRTKTYASFANFPASYARLEIPQVDLSQPGSGSNKF
jgi:hypothetical protein